MEKKNRVIIVALIGVFVLFIGLGVLMAITKGSSGNSTSGTSGSAFTGSILPFIAIFIIFMQPTSPVNNSLSVLSNKKYNQEQRAKYIENYISKNFKESEAYINMIGEQWPKNKKTEIKEKGQEKSIVLLELVNGDRYEFEVVKRTKDNSAKQASMWIINDYKRI